VLTIHGAVFAEGSQRGLVYIRSIIVAMFRMTMQLLRGIVMQEALRGAECGRGGGQFAEFIAFRDVRPGVSIRSAKFERPGTSSNKPGDKDLFCQVALGISCPGSLQLCLCTLTALEALRTSSLSPPHECRPHSRGGFGLRAMKAH
jgi:hypothetical protein